MEAEKRDENPQAVREINPSSSVSGCGARSGPADLIRRLDARSAFRSLIALYHEAGGPFSRTLAVVVERSCHLVFPAGDIRWDLLVDDNGLSRRQGYAPGWNLYS